MNNTDGKCQPHFTNQAQHFPQQQPVPSRPGPPGESLKSHSPRGAHGAGSGRARRSPATRTGSWQSMDGLMLIQGFQQQQCQESKVLIEVIIRQARSLPVCRVSSALAVLTLLCSSSFTGHKERATRPSSSPARPSGGICLPGAAQPHAMQDWEELLVSPVCGKAGIPGSRRHRARLVVPSPSFSGGFLAPAARRLRVASSVPGKGEGRTGKSL